jgi:hypothetical protein
MPAVPESADSGLIGSNGRRKAKLGGLEMSWSQSRDSLGILAKLGRQSAAESPSRERGLTRWRLLVMLACQAQQRQTECTPRKDTSPSLPMALFM